MSTYAQYRIWSGITLDALGDFRNEFLDEILTSWDVEQNLLNFIPIGMHGEIIGIGVEIFKLNWETEINDKNIFDVGIGGIVEQVRCEVDLVFEMNNVPFCARSYHYVDLGG